MEMEVTPLAPHGGQRRAAEPVPKAPKKEAPRLSTWRVGVLVGRGPL